MTSDWADQENEGAGTGFLAQIPTILWHRRWLVIGPLVLGAIAALAAILLVPVTYRSSAVILVQSPQLPGEVIGGDEQYNVIHTIDRIREQITSRSDLIALIDKHGLYGSERARRPLSKIIEKMRSSIVLLPTISDVQNDNSKDRTTSVRLDFFYRTPIETQAVAQELMERVLALSSSQNTTRAASTVDFLTDQANNLRKQISDVEGEIAAISTRNGRALAGSTMVMGGSSATYDVEIGQFQRENAALMAQRQNLQAADGRDPIVLAAEGQLAAARAVYSENHPDVIAARQRLAEARAQAATRPKQNTAEQIENQIAFNNAQIAALRSAKAGESAQISESLRAQAQGPAAQQRITQLQQQLSGLNEQYQTVSSRLLAARAGVRAQDEQMGEHFTLVDPPIVPDTPYSPNRPLLAALGLAGGLGLGLVLAFAAEFVLKPIRGPEAILAIDGEVPLGVVPMIRPAKVKPERNSRFSFWPIGRRAAAEA